MTVYCTKTLCIVVLRGSCRPPAKAIYVLRREIRITDGASRQNILYLDLSATFHYLNDGIQPEGDFIPKQSYTVKCDIYDRFVQNCVSYRHKENRISFFICHEFTDSLLRSLTKLIQVPIKGKKTKKVLEKIIFRPKREQANWYKFRNFYS